MSDLGPFDPQDVEEFQRFVRETAESGGHGSIDIEKRLVEHIPTGLPLSLIRRPEGDHDNMARFEWVALRRCTVCGAQVGADRPDACLGELPGVTEACCGHGVPRHAYITFESGLIIRGFSLQKRPNNWGQSV